jgi:excisionase family DNA binding protein
MAIDNNVDPMLTVGEVSTLLHIHPNTLRRWADKGLIKSFCITPRGDRRFTSQDVDEFLNLMNSQNQGRSSMPLESNMSESRDFH